ncbi:MAG: hypothetical protein IPF69_10970 [Chitinophagaceae bacterium]|nr:hypothetical protein [Chitinophagaceae bacterium]MBK9659672.1 hypothetical protein [Chitinophagaceae bacterium]MBP6234189.1 hypothetical protein [Chitinophagaceae bacterium]MBP6416524.1 hypothetical protein [Chitinophagaceae bacterium]
MKFIKATLLFLLVLLLTRELSAKERNRFLNDTTIATKRITGDEKQAIADAINKYLDVAGIKIGDLGVSTTSDGDKEASGNVSFFGFDNINLKAVMSADRKIKSINTTFPDAATISPEKLVKFFSGKSLGSFLPQSFPLSTGISIKDLSIEFDDKGDSLSKVALNFGVGAYAIDGFDGFAIDGMAIGFTLDKPTSPQRKATATISGDGKLGAIPINLSANMSSEPDDLLFSFTASNIGISSLLNSFMSESKANKLLRFIPASFKSKEISSITASINPTNKNFSALAQTSFGETEIQFNGATAEDKSTMLFAVAPPAGFKFSQLASALSPMDGIDLSGTALIISTLADEDAKCNLSALKDEGDIKVEEGVNIFSSIKMSDDLAKLLKVNAIKLKGTVNETFTNMSMQAALDLNIPMGDNITMKEVVFGTRLGTINPIEFSIGGKIEAKIGEDLVGFNASFAFAPIDQKISGEFFMAALQKKNASMVAGNLGPDGKSDLPEWTNPFGIPGVGLRKLGVNAGLDFKNPILISSLGLTGAARLGTVNDRNKHIEGDATIVVDITKPTNSLIDITMKNMTILAMIEAFVDNANIQGQLRTMLNTGIDNGRVLVVPVDGMVAFGKTYNKGVAVSCQLSLAGIKGNGDFSLNESGVAGGGSLDAINWGNGAFIISGRTTDRPQFKFAYTKGSVPTFFIDGKISLLGISSETTASLDANGLEFTTTGKIADLFEATLEGKANFSESSKGVYVRASLRNDLISQLNQLVTGKLDEAIASTKKTLQGTRDKLNKAKDDLKEIDTRLATKRAQVTSRRNADLQKMRDEAQRALNESKTVIDWHKSNNTASNKRINELGNWPWELAEKAALYTAIGFNLGAIEAEQVVYDGYAKTVNGLSDIGKEFPVEVELADLYAEKYAKEGALTIALAGVDVAEGVSVATLETTKFVMDQALGGLFDIKSAEFEGTFGLNNQYKINVAFNITLAKKPYNFSAEIDFNNLASSAGKIATDVLSGKLIKPGFAKTFATELKQPVSSNKLVSAPVLLQDITTPKPKVLHTYLVTVETAADADAGSNEKFAVIITGDNGMTEKLTLTKSLNTIPAGEKTTFSVQTEKNVGNITKIQMIPLNASMTDNIKMKSINVEMPAEKKNVHAECTGCVISGGQTTKTIAFDGKKYADYWITISTNMAQNSGTNGSVSLSFKGDAGEYMISDMKRYFPTSTFTTGAVTEVPVSIPDIGQLQKLTIGGGNFFDNWNIGGVIVRDANGVVKAGYCNCSLDGNKQVAFNLLPPDYFADYRIIIQTDNRVGGTFDVDRSGTDSKEYLTIIGDKGQTERIDLGNVMTASPGVFGLENLFEAGSSNFGYITTKNIGTIQRIIIDHVPLTAFEDKWDIKNLVIESYSNGNKNVATVRDLAIDKRSSGFQRPVELRTEKITTTKPVVNPPITTPVKEPAKPVTNQPTAPVTPAAISNKIVRIENLWKTTDRIHIETGAITATPINDGAWSAQWLLKPVPGTNYFWIENKWKPDHRINVENGAIAAGPIQDGAWSAHWELKKYSEGVYWIENRWKTGERIHVENGKLECGKIQDGANNAMWNITIAK